MADSTKNFLPEMKYDVTSGGGKKTIKCSIRNRQVDAKPEEFVRQRVLDWLLMDKKWPDKNIRLEKSHKLHGNKNRSHIRSDIELLDSKGNVTLVVECKSENVVLTESANIQAKEYARKSGAKNIWVTNGIDHRFLIKNGKKWEFVEKLPLLNVQHKHRSMIPEFPDEPNRRNIISYLTKRERIGDPAFADHPLEMRRVVASLYKLFYHTDLELPYSEPDFHILEDCGPMYMSVGNRGGGGYQGLYRGFIVASTGRVETLFLGISYSSGDHKHDTYGVQINVGTSTEKGASHKLQLSLTKDDEFISERISPNSSKKYWEISHDGKMSGINRQKVIDSVRETEAEQLLYQNKDGKEMIKLGNLHFPESNSTWKNSRELIINLLHYGLIRYNLSLSHKKPR